MKNNEFTPGPWTAVYTQVWAKGKCIAVVGSCDEYTEELGNAQMMADAPTLYQRVRSLRRALTGAALVIALQWAIILWLTFTREATQATLTPVLLAASFTGITAGLLIAAGVTLLTRSR